MMRSIWLCADDYGMAPGVNAAIRDLIERGRLNATSVMTAQPACDADAARALLDCVGADKNAAIGLHVTLTAPFRPLTPNFTPLSDGAFPTLTPMLLRALARQLDRAALAREVDAQFTRFAELFGRAPDFVDGHQHVQLFPQIRDAVLAATAKHAPGARVRQGGRAQPAGLGDPKGMLLDALSRTFKANAAAFGLATNPAFAGTYTFSSATDFSRIFPSFLNGLPDGGLVMCHPGFVDATLERLDPVTQLRQREHAYFASDAFLADLQKADVTLARP
ncbi:hypothetical protein GJW-30_1_01259 [Variibacter gotjawalensis]|uniref:ChbG/HpnK family deacetylase n=2 Tax=Variibacter gotjawalensis TaxID=1333996 RepID=A0A0S3PS90_9BRAD|nr:hypothetical protein EV661_3369 [Variibacter gotjawalensis]BAT58732.1 hypothetical protein GJW-30_1_01259 [Variibacter gotjawalensis]